MSLGNTLLELESLRCFVHAAQTLNFRAAAKLVHLSAPAFGQRIARLERELGVSLFHRSTRRVELTSAGERVLARARKLLADVDSLHASAHDEEQHVPVELTIATRFELGLSWLTPALTKLAKVRPRRKLHLSFGDSPAMIRRTVQGLVDAAVTSAHTLPASLDFHVLHPEEYVLVGLPTASGRSWQLNERQARRLTLLDIDHGLPLFNYFIRAQKSSAPWRFADVESLGTIAAIRLRALEGAGVAVLPRYFVSKDLAARRLVTLSPKSDLRQDSFRLIWRRDHPRSQDLVRLAKDLLDLPLR